MKSAIKNNNIAVVIPAYRVEKHIQNVIKSVPHFVQYIVVVDDNSPDNTGELVDSLGDERVYLVRHQVNEGVGGAVLTGYRKAIELGADIIVKIDGDDQMDLDYIGKLIEPIWHREADYCKGNRFLDVVELKQMPFKRRMGNIALSFLTKIASGYWNIFDPTNGFTAINSSVFLMLDQSKINKRYFFEISMLIELRLIQAVVKDIQIPARYGDESSNLSEIKAFLTFPRYLFKGFSRRIKIQYFIRDFGLFSILFFAGLLLTLFGSIWGLYNWLVHWKMGTITPTGTVMLSVLPLILGVEFLLNAIFSDISNVPVQPISKRVNRQKSLINFLQRKSQNG